MPPSSSSHFRRRQSFITAAQTLLSTAAAFLLSLAPILVPSPVVAAATAPVEDNATFDVVLSQMGPNKISVIKEIRDVLPGMGLAEAKALVESAPKLIKRGVTKTEAEKIKQQVEAAGATVTISASPAPSGFDVVLTDIGSDKIAVVKAVRDALRVIGLAEAKTLVENSPAPIKRDVTKAEAEQIKQQVEAAGGQITIQSAAATASFDAILTEMGPNKISVIKEIRDILPGMGLAEAKTLVESAPKPIKRSISKTEAEQIKQKLEAAGAQVTIKQH